MSARPPAKLDTYRYRYIQYRFLVRSSPVPFHQISTTDRTHVRTGPVPYSTGTVEFRSKFPVLPEIGCHSERSGTLPFFSGPSRSERYGTVKDGRCVNNPC